MRPGPGYLCENGDRNVGGYGLWLQWRRGLRLGSYRGRVETRQYEPCVRFPTRDSAETSICTLEIGNEADGDAICFIHTVGHCKQLQAATGGYCEGDGRCDIRLHTIACHEHDTEE